MDSVVEVRCPIGPRRLFTKLRLGAETARYVQPQNWLEMACSDCRDLVRRTSGTPVARVLHRYNFLGELVETVIVARI